MRHTDVVVIGAGQAGLAMSHCLSLLGISHVVLERGRVVERWRSERWDLLRLLTPNWMTRLPDWSYQGSEPDGFMTAAAFVSELEGYARAFCMPVVTDAAVQSVRRVAGGYRVETGRGVWQARSVVIATGHCDVPFVPHMARNLPTSIRQVTPSAYRNPAELPAGGVLVVGASASGLQLAEEIQQSGRQVTISVGRHTRLPRLYRGRDIMWWLDQCGVLRRRADTAADLRAARSQPSMQLVGRPERSNLDLGVLRDIGVRVIGHAAGMQDGIVHLNDDLAETVADSQVRMERLLERIDPVADAAGAPAETWPDDLGFGSSPAVLDLVAEGIRTVVWATGFKRNYSWLHVPVLDASGDIMHSGGATASYGLYVTGLRYLRRRDPSSIAAAGPDAAELADEIRCYLHGVPCAAA